MIDIVHGPATSKIVAFKIPHIISPKARCMTIMTSHVQAWKPEVTLEMAVAIAQDVWGLRVVDDGEAARRPKQLDSYDDNNFYMPGWLGGVERKFLLKVHNGVESANPVVLDFQNKMMAALTGGFPCPIIACNQSLLN
jgi:hypothetical protein